MKFLAQQKRSSLACLFSCDRLRKRFRSTYREVALGQWCGLALLMAMLTPAFGLQMPGDGAQGLPDMPSVRGTVKSIHGSDVIVQTEAGATYSIHIGDNTHLYKSRQPLKLSDIRAGDMLIGAGSLDERSSLLRAVFVADVDAATVEKLRNDLGKTWIAGNVLKIDETKITVERIDHHTQVIEADETTSFRKDGQSITLLDVHAGDPIRGKGGLKNGVFVPSQLTVIDPARQRSTGTPMSREQ